MTQGFNRLAPARPGGSFVFGQLPLASSVGGGGLSMQSFVGDGSVQPLDVSSGPGSYFVFVDSDPDHLYVEIPDAASALGYVITFYGLTVVNRCFMQCPSTGQFVGTSNVDYVDMGADAGGTGHSATIACNGNYWYVVNIW